MSLTVLAAAAPYPAFPISESRFAPALPIHLRAVASSGSGSSERLSCRGRRTSVRARAGAGGGRRESPHEVLGVPPSADPGEIKRSYRRLALKYHPDVNKEANAQEKFLRIKHAYNTLMNSETRSKYASSGTDSSSSRASRKSKSADAEEEFYGFGDFLKDLQTEFQNWEAELNSQQKPKSLWEELSAIGEEFVEFLENELKIDDDSTLEEDGRSDPYTKFGGRGKNDQDESTSTNNDDEIESVLEQLKRELGLS